MKEEDKLNRAPLIGAKALWAMRPDDFNRWRKENDYPRIISFFKEKLPLFKKWMDDQKISDEILIEYSPSSFLKEKGILYLYTILDKESRKSHVLRTSQYNNADSSTIEQVLEIIPYPKWFYKNRKSDAKLNLSITYSSGRSHFFMEELELLDLGNIRLYANPILSKRNLDFVNLDNLDIENAVNNTYLKIWFSSALNLSIKGDLAFVDAYKTNFYNGWNSQHTNLKLSYGKYQNWSFEDCNLSLNISYSVIVKWNVIGSDFSCNLNLSDIKESNFSNGDIKYSFELGKAKEFHANIKRLYSQIGKKKEAGKHYYIEKKFERKMFLNLEANFSEEYGIARRNHFILLILHLKYFSKYIISSFQNILWGYGERPSRVFIISIISIFAFALLFCFCPNSTADTKGDIWNSLYYSIVTFTTLGFGDKLQTDIILKLASGLEALLGMSFWGILISGFSNNSKDY